MKKNHVYGVGNALVDMEIEVSPEFLSKHNIEKGLMTLIDEDRQQQLIEALDGQQAHRRSCGGSAANTLIAVSQMGGRGFYSCKVASDETGDFYFEDLLNNGLKTNLSSQRDKGSTGRCMVFVTPDADRTMCSHLGITESFSEKELDEDELRDSEFVYLEGYLVTSPTGRAAAIKAREMAEKARVKTAITLSDPGVVEHFKEGFMEMIGKKVDLLFCNEQEAYKFTGETHFEAASKKISEIAHSFSITRGPKGAYVYDGAREFHILSPRVDAIDTNGAGDLFAGAFLYGVTHGHSFGDAGRLACQAASTLVTKFGARLNKNEAQEIRSFILD